MPTSMGIGTDGCGSKVFFSRSLYGRMFMRLRDSTPMYRFSVGLG